MQEEAKGARTNVREKFLRECVEGRGAMRIIMRNGFQMEATVTGYDDSVITANAGGVEKMLCLSAISTIEPAPVQRYQAPRPYYVNAPWGNGRSSERRFLD